MPMNEMPPRDNNSLDAAAQVVAQHYRMRMNTGHYALQGGPVAFIIVKQPAELASALSQREKAVVIDKVPENKKLTFIFNLSIRFDRWWWIGALLAYAIYLGSGAQYSHTEWRAGKTTEDKIILMPRGK